MARQIIVTTQDVTVAPGVYVFQVVYWAAVPAARQTFYANAGATSQVTGLTAPELTAIQNGSVAEKAARFSILNNGQSLAALFPTIQTQLQAEFATWQAFVNASNPWVHFGTSWDGTTWTVQTIA